MPQKTALYGKSATLRWPRKQKRRDPLSINMISLPLGDFRHLSHVGLDARGDGFGDLSVFQRSNSLILHSSQSHQDLLQTITPPAPPKPPRLLSPEDMEAQAVTKPRALTLEPRLKCHSLPLLDAVSVVECDQPLRQQEPEKGQWGAEEAALRMRSEESGVGWCGEAPAAEEDLSFSLILDLGPSILEDVLQVMDRLHQ